MGNPQLISYVSFWLTMQVFPRKEDLNVMFCIISQRYSHQINFYNISSPPWWSHQGFEAFVLRVTTTLMVHHERTTIFAFSKKEVLALLGISNSLKPTLSNLGVFWSVQKSWGYPLLAIVDSIILKVTLTLSTPTNRNSKATNWRCLRLTAFSWMISMKAAWLHSMWHLSSTLIKFWDSSFVLHHFPFHIHFETHFQGKCSVRLSSM